MCCHIADSINNLAMTDFYKSRLKSFAFSRGLRVKYSTPYTVNGTIFHSQSGNSHGTKYYTIELTIGDNVFRGSGPTPFIARSSAEYEAYKGLCGNEKVARQIDETLKDNCVNTKDSSADKPLQFTHSDCENGPSALSQTSCELSPTWDIILTEASLKDEFELYALSGSDDDLTPEHEPEKKETNRVYYTVPKTSEEVLSALCCPDSPPSGNSSGDELSCSPVFRRGLEDDLLLDAARKGYLVSFELALKSKMFIVTATAGEHKATCKNPKKKLARLAAAAELLKIMKTLPDKVGYEHFQAKNEFGLDNPKHDIPKRGDESPAKCISSSVSGPHLPIKGLPQQECTQTRAVVTPPNQCMPSYSLNQLQDSVTAPTNHFQTTLFLSQVANSNAHNSSFGPRPPPNFLSKATSVSVPSHDSLSFSFFPRHPLLSPPNSLFPSKNVSKLSPLPAEVSPLLSRYPNPIGYLQEFMMRKKQSLPVYRTSTIEHRGTVSFNCTVEANGFSARGAGTSKKEARKAAALNLLLLLEEENGVDMFLKKRKQRREYKSIVPVEKRGSQTPPTRSSVRRYLSDKNSTTEYNDHNPLTKEGIGFRSSIPVILESGDGDSDLDEVTSFAGFEINKTEGNKEREDKKESADEKKEPSETKKGLGDEKMPAESIETLKDDSAAKKHSEGGTKESDKDVKTGEESNAAAMEENSKDPAVTIGQSNNSHSAHPEAKLVGEQQKPSETSTQKDVPAKTESGREKLAADSKKATTESSSSIDANVQAASESVESMLKDILEFSSSIGHDASKKGSASVEA